MPSSFKLEIITPERTFFSGEVESLVVVTPEGEVGILKGHQPFVASVEISRIRLKIKGEWKYCVTTRGFMEVRPDQVLIFSQAVEWPEEIDINRARAAKERAEEEMRQKRSLQEYTQSKMALARAMMRISATSKKNH